MEESISAALRSSTFLKNDSATLGYYNDWINNNDALENVICDQLTAMSGKADILKKGPRNEVSSMVFASAFSGSNCSICGSLVRRVGMNSCR